MGVERKERERAESVFYPRAAGGWLGAEERLTDIHAGVPPRRAVAAWTIQSMVRHRH